MKKMPADYKYVEDMYDDNYYPDHLVDKVKDVIVKVVCFIEEGGHSKDEIQAEFDKAMDAINDLQDDFWEADSEIETVARDSIGVTVIDILKHFEIDIDHEEAMRNRDW